MDDDESEQFLQKIVSCPRETQWRNPHDVQLEKLSNDSLGIVLKTCQVSTHFALLFLNHYTCESLFSEGWLKIEKSKECTHMQ